MADAETPEGTADETPEQKRERVMRRLAEILRADPPDLAASGAGPVSADGVPIVPENADEFDQEAAAKLFEELGRFFGRKTREEGPGGVERE